MLREEFGQYKARRQQAIILGLVMFCGDIWVEEVMIKAGSELDEEVMREYVKSWQECCIGLPAYIRDHFPKIKFLIGSWEGGA